MAPPANYTVLKRTKVTDAGLAHLKPLESLELLHFSNTRVTDAGLPSLKALKHVKGIELSGTQITDAGIAELKRALPKLVIQKDGRTY